VERQTLRATSRVSIQGIDVECIIGVTERERAQTQRLEIDLQLHFDFTEARRSDSIADTVDYRLVRGRAVEACEKSSFQLIETLAGHLGEVILGDSPASPPFASRSTSPAG